MALGDQGAYGTVLRLTPLTDGTLDSIRMTNPGTTYEAGVMPGAWCLAADFVCQRSRGRPGALNSYVGECGASSAGCETSGDAARQWYPGLPKGGPGQLVEPVDRIRARGGTRVFSGHESTDRSLPV